MFLECRPRGSATRLLTFETRLPRPSNKCIERHRHDSLGILSEKTVGDGSLVSYSPVVGCLCAVRYFCAAQALHCWRAVDPGRSELLCRDMGATTDHKCHLGKQFDNRNPAWSASSGWRGTTSSPIWGRMARLCVCIPHLESPWKAPDRCLATSTHPATSSSGQQQRQAASQAQWRSGAARR